MISVFVGLRRRPNLWLFNTTDEVVLNEKFRFWVHGGVLMVYWSLANTDP